MSLIARQDQLVTQLEPIYRQRIAQGYMGGHLCGRRARLNRLHIESMVKDGYTKPQAAESAQQCNDIAALNVASTGSAP